MAVASLDGRVHLVAEDVVASSDAGRYSAARGASFIPGALIEPDDGDACRLCRGQQSPPNAATEAST